MEQAAEVAEKHPAFITRQQLPLNGGPPLELLVQSFVTPHDLFFVRTHGSVPVIEAASYWLEVGGMVERSLMLSLEELMRLRQHEVVTTIQCAGNRRSELIAQAAIPNETTWGAEAISTAAWSGVLLRDLLALAGIQPQATQIAFLGLDDVEIHGRTGGFGGSIPIAWAHSSDVLLATSMNNRPLAPLHGFPLRVVVPGYIGARSVKWLGRITAQATPSDNYFQAEAYRLHPPQAGPESNDQGFALGELSVNAVICSPLDGAVLPAGPQTIKGYATAGGARCVERVDLSLDNGATWQQAMLGQQQEPAAWRLWQAEVTLDTNTVLIARAWDSAANTQPEQPVWNYKGYMNNGWHRVQVNLLRDG